METPRHKAAREGSKKYKGKPCKKCGGTDRYTSTGGCIECTKQASIKSRDDIRSLMSEARGA